MGSAQSARRIQPGGGPGRAGGPADLSRSPCLPTPPPALPPPLAAVPPSASGRAAGGGGGVAGVGGRGRGWGRRGTAPRPATGRRRAHFHRGGAPRPAPGRLGRPGGGRWLGGAPPPSRGGGGPTLPECYSPPGSSARRIPGPREPALVAALSPLPALPPPRGAAPARGRPPRGARRGLFPGGPGRPSHGATALPPRPASPPPRGWGGVGAGRTVPSAPRAGRAVGPGGSRLGEPQERQASARGPRRCRPPTRPVLKHGPRSLTRARVRGSHESRRGAMKVKAALSRRPRWDPEASPSPPRAHHRPVSPAAPGRWSTSARVRTRKMVNYAWAGRSQRKLWWRSVAVLTCKSVVRPGYRGERLIEPSSSWFPPKFPSG